MHSHFIDEEAEIQRGKMTCYFEMPLLPELRENLGFFFNCVYLLTLKNCLLWIKTKISGNIFKKATDYLLFVYNSNSTGFVL